MNTAALALFGAVFLACMVEAVEATTIVLAAGTTRECWLVPATPACEAKPQR